MRRVHKELTTFNAAIKREKKSLSIMNNCDLQFTMVNKLMDESKTERINYEHVFAFVFKVENVPNSDLLKLKSKKWERLKTVELQLYEKSVIWRLWHNALINFKIANIMGLMSNSTCPYCFIEHSDCRHIIFCKSSEILWRHIWYKINQSGIKINNPDRMNGVDKPSYVNTLIYLSINILYKRFLYNINSGLTDYDLLEQFNVRLYELIYSSYTNSKRKNSIDKFLNYWNEGKGLFMINLSGDPVLL